MTDDDGPPISMKTIVLVVVLCFLTGWAWVASTYGWGLEQPEANGPSIREGSTRVGTGRRPARFFIGGGFSRGK